jgi:hypothetical protein
MQTLPRSEVSTAVAGCSERSTSRGVSASSAGPMHPVQDREPRRSSEQPDRIGIRWFLPSQCNAECEHDQRHAQLAKYDQLAAIDRVRERATEQAAHDRWHELNHPQDAGKNRRLRRLVQHERQRDVAHHRAEQADELSEIQQAKIAPAKGGKIHRGRPFPTLRLACPTSRARL